MTYDGTNGWKSSEFSLNSPLKGDAEQEAIDKAESTAGVTSYRPSLSVLSPL
jgi:hypothetical protein